MRGRNGRNRWTLFLFLLAGMVLGSFLAHYLSQYPYLEWLDFGRTFGLTGPVTFSLGVLTLTFGFTLQINIGSLIGMLLGYAAYRFAEG
ncbi:MAG: DUF4321 domain-containing protein [Clostridiales bacterium]|jgi:hypothetical protein|nr:DUF4321 domain-containing protein [Clostridiales bacterium]